MTWLKSCYQHHQALFIDEPATYEFWEKHRNANARHWPDIKTLLTVAEGFVVQILAVVVVAIGVGLYDTFGVKRSGAPMLESLYVFLSTLTFALALLLVFKTNSAYGRWWEARILWGRLVVMAQNMVRQAAAMLPPADRARAALIVRWTSACGWVVKSQLRQHDGLEAALQGLLLPDELKWLLQQRHRSLALAAVLSGAVCASQNLDSNLKAIMDAQIAEFVLVQGSCARIFATPIPSAYTRHTSRFLMTYLLLLPVALWWTCGWATPVLAACAAFLLLGVENIGAQIEQPFAVLPLDAMCRTIQRDCLEALDVVAAPPAWLLQPGLPPAVSMHPPSAGGRESLQTMAPDASCTAQPPPVDRHPLPTGTC